MTTEDEVRLLELQLADIKRRIAYHEGALQDLWMQLMELRARVTAARRQIMGEIATNEFPPNRLIRRWGRFDAPDMHLLHRRLRPTAPHR